MTRSVTSGTGTDGGATTPLTFEIGPRIDGFRAETEDASPDLAESTTFRIVQTEPGANIRAASVLVDGVESTAEAEPCDRPSVG